MFQSICIYNIKIVKLALNKTKNEYTTESVQCRYYIVANNVERTLNL
jgi:hypothetical protein